jgi:predicted  nucleic acid-binding Zn-ribbon protein
MTQEVLNWAFGAAGAAIGWVLKVVWDAIQRLQSDMREIEKDLPEIYVRKDDFRASVTDLRAEIKEVRTDMKDGFRTMNDTLGLIFKKLESKEDKGG